MYQGINKYLDLDSMVGFYGNNILINDNSRFYVYDRNGNKIIESKDYDQIRFFGFSTLLPNGGISSNQYKNNGLIVLKDRDVYYIDIKENIISKIKTLSKSMNIFNISLDASNDKLGIYFENSDLKLTDFTNDELKEEGYENIESAREFEKDFIFLTEYEYYFSTNSVRERKSIYRLP